MTQSFIVLSILIFCIALFISYCISNKEGFKFYRKYKKGIWFQYQIREIKYCYWTQELNESDRLVQTEKYE